MAADATDHLGRTTRALPPVIATACRVCSVLGFPTLRSDLTPNRNLKAADLVPSTKLLRTFCFFLMAVASAVAVKRKRCRVLCVLRGQIVFVLL